MSTDELLSITEVSEMTGLQSSALRYYETVGLIRSDARVGGRRHYDRSVLHRLAVIAVLQEAGFTIAEVGKLVDRGGRGQRWRAMAESKLKEIDAHLARVETARELLTAALDCDCSGLESCELVSERRGRHRKVVQTLPLRMGRPGS